MGYPRKKKRYKKTIYVWRIFNKNTNELVSGRRNSIDFYTYCPTWKKIRTVIDRNLQQGFTEEYIKENYFVVKYKLVEVKVDEIRDSADWYRKKLEKEGKENG